MHESRKALLSVLWVFGVVTVSILGVQPCAAQKYHVIHTFNGTNGWTPETVLNMDAAGNLYGTTAGGGTSTNCAGGPCGTVFKIDTKGNETVLHSFSGTDGSTPFTSVILDTAGNLYGATSFGGPGNPPSGVVFKLDPKGNETILHSFPKKTPGDGEVLQFARLAMDSAGNLYGSTLQGGGTGCRSFGCGTVFKIDTKNHETITRLNANISAPTSIVRDAKGNIYGTTLLGGGVGCGGVGCGTVFKIDTNGKLSLVYAFQGAPDGGEPSGSLTLDSTGNLYGTTLVGGNALACPSAGCGTIFKIDTKGKESIVHKFDGTDGAMAFWAGGLVFDPKGNLYGVAAGGGKIGAGTIFKIDTKGSLTVLYSFTGGPDGGFPMAGLIIDKAGRLYGTASAGGDTITPPCFPVGCGTVFRLTP